MQQKILLARLFSWWEQCLLRRTPQSDPLSTSVMFTALASYALIDLLQAKMASNWQTAIGMTLLDVAVLMLFARLVLHFTGRSARYVQTLTALAGTGAVLGVLGLPLVMQAVKAQQNGEVMGTLVLGWLILLIWNISVQAHIYRHALSSRFGVGLIVSGLHAVTVMILMEYFFPRTAA